MRGPSMHREDVPCRQPSLKAGPIVASTAFVAHSDCSIKDGLVPDLLELGAANRAFREGALLPSLPVIYLNMDIIK